LDKTLWEKYEPVSVNIAMQKLGSSHVSMFGSSKLNIKGILGFHHYHQRCMSIWFQNVIHKQTMQPISLSNEVLLGLARKKQ